MIKKILNIFFILLLMFTLFGCRTPIEENPFEDPKTVNPPVVNDENQYILGTEAAKILLANERLTEDDLEETGLLTVGVDDMKTLKKNVFQTLSFRTTLSTNNSGQKYEDGVITWYPESGYSNMISFYDSYVINIENLAERGIEDINNVKKYIRVVNKWINVSGEKIMLIVNESSETIYKVDDYSIEVFTRYTNDNGQNVYERYEKVIATGEQCRIKYIPNIRYEFSVVLDGYNHYLVADNTKGYWDMISVNDAVQTNGDIDYSMQNIVLKDEVCYVSYYWVSKEIQDLMLTSIVTPDRKNDLLSIYQNSIELISTGLTGIDSFTLEASEDQIVSTIDASYDNAYAFYDVAIDGTKYYSCSGAEATVHTDSGLDINYLDKFVNDKVMVTRILVTTLSDFAPNPYGVIQLLVDAADKQERMSLLKEFFNETGISLICDVEETFEAIELALVDSENFQKYHLWNGYRVNDYEQLSLSVEYENKYLDYLYSYYDNVKDYDVIDINDQEKILANINFAEIKNQSNYNVSFNTVDNEVNISDLTFTIADTTLFVTEEEYSIVIALATKIDDKYINVVPLASCYGTTTVQTNYKYNDENEFSLSIDGSFSLVDLGIGKYSLVAYVATSMEKIRVSKIVPLNNSEELLITNIEFAHALETESSITEIRTLVINIYSENNEIIYEIVDINYMIVIDKLLVEGIIDYQYIFEELAVLAYKYGEIPEEEFAVIEIYDSELDTWNVVSSDKILDGKYRLAYMANDKVSYVYLMLA